MKRFFISPKEAVTLQDFISYPTLQQAQRIANECRKKTPVSEYGTALLFSTLYNAGVIDGIRRVRAKIGGG